MAPQLFGIPEPEALLLDPQQRLVLETVYEALHLGGTSKCPGGSLSVAPEPPVGVYIGAASSDYGSIVARNHQPPSSAPGPYHASANALSVLAGRVSFVFGFTGG